MNLIKEKLTESLKSVLPIALIFSLPVDDLVGVGRFEDFAEE